MTSTRLVRRLVGVTVLFPHRQQVQYIVDRFLRQARAGVQDRDAPREARRRRRRQQAVGAPESSPERVEVRLNFYVRCSKYYVFKIVFVIRAENGAKVTL